MPYALFATLLVAVLAVHFLLRADAYPRSKVVVGVAWLISVLVAYAVPQWALAGTLLQVLLGIGLLLHARLRVRERRQP